MSKWIDVNLPFGPEYSQGFAIRADTFLGRELMVPGIQIELDDGRRFLVGDVNTCGEMYISDEGEIAESTVVRRYRVLVPSDVAKADEVIEAKVAAKCWRCEKLCPNEDGMCITCTHEDG